MEIKTLYARRETRSMSSPHVPPRHQPTSGWVDTVPEPTMEWKPLFRP